MLESERTSKENLASKNVHVISLPKGGGAIHGIGEKFAANPVTGTASMTVPIYTTSGRSGFGPQLWLSYNSGGGNGPFGFGWQLSIPSITRKTDKGMPKYEDNCDSEIDIFILSEAEDLIPELVRTASGDWQRQEISRMVKGIGYRILRYRPRIEGLFALIERWTNTQTGEIHWRSISKDNITTLYGATSESRIADPYDPSHIFSWLISETYDDKGNVMLYQYKAENSQRIDAKLFVHERNRTDRTRSANRYLKRIKYGNVSPYKVSEDLSLRTDWMFEVVCDYGEHYTEDDLHQPKSVFVDDSRRGWDIRQDPFSIYRSGFEIRTYRLCQRVLMFHHFSQELGVNDYLVRSTEFDYSSSPIASFITAVTQAGFILKDDTSYSKKSLPPLEFGYSQANIQNKVQEIDKDSLENLPAGVDGKKYQWIDLDGEGLSGILTEQGGAWFYKHNISGLPIAKRDDDRSDSNKNDGEPKVHFSPMQTEMTIPSSYDISSGGQHFTDLGGAGKLDLVKLDSASISGYYKRSNGKGWDAFVPFSSIPNIDWNDPNLRFIDLTGDGCSDILITEDQVFTWYPSLAEKGFAEQGQKIYQALDEEKGPKLIFADGTQSIYLSDMSGDGLIDLVRISNGEVCYWPNIGYGRFGAKITMDNSPWFDKPDQFDQGRIRLADIDGSGTTDIIYFGADGIHIYRNQSGNGYSNRQVLNVQFPHVDDSSSYVTVLDLFGNGTACIIWSSSSPADFDMKKPMYYIDLMGGQKPHLLISIKNNMGSETKISYTSSTRFYLSDKLAGRPWITRLPFPVHVIERVDVFDRISKNLFVTRYAYHHGYFDGVEREFRGFGMVEQWDTEEFSVLNSDYSISLTSEPVSNIDESSHVPPVLTKTWFHTGAYLIGDYVSLYFAEEYYGAPKKGDPDYNKKFNTFEKTLLSDTVLPNSIHLPDERQISWNLKAEELRQACRALKGSVLRQEIYGLDHSTQSDHPYSVSERNYTVELLQPIAGHNKHAVFFTHPRETVDYHYERNPDDPRISHSITLEVDAFGNVLRSAACGYGRKQRDTVLTVADQLKQTKMLLTYTENHYTNHIDLADSYRVPQPSESLTYEVTGLAKNALEERLDFTALDHAVTIAAILPYEATPTDDLQKRLISHFRVMYRKDDLSGPLPLGQVESMALPFEDYKLAFTSGLISKIYENRVSGTMLSNEGGYVRLQGDANNWWLPSGKVFFSTKTEDTSSQELVFAQDHFFLPHRFQNPFSFDTLAMYDKYNLMLQETRDPLDNIMTVMTKNDEGKDLIALDYRVIKPWLVVDPNGNRSAVAFDALGIVVGTAVMGKLGESAGDSLEGFESDLEESTIIEQIQDPLKSSHTILRKATTRSVYDLRQYYRTRNNTNPLPNVVYTLVRETHDSDLRSGEFTRIQHSFSYYDGFGRDIQNKIQAEPGDLGGTFVDPRWVGSGWTIFNNKGKPVKVYEPFFSKSHTFEFAEAGVSPILFYDAAERQLATLNPNHTYEKTIFSSWQNESWDVNDTVQLAEPKNDPYIGEFFHRLPDIDYLPTWYENRKNGKLGVSEQEAAQRAATHANTPTIAYFDALGRTFLIYMDNGTDGKYATRFELDIQNNQLAVLDPLQRTVMQYYYDILGNRVKQVNMDTGTRWMLNDVEGNVVYRWDNRGNVIHTVYDALRRPADILLSSSDEKERLVERIVYGEAQGVSLNHRGRVFKHFDGAGIMISEAYDFKGNILRTSRQLSVDYKHTLNWSENIILEDEVYKNSTYYDALNRIITLITPDNSIIHPTYNASNLLERVEANVRAADTLTTFVDDINYNAKGQQVFIRYGNRMHTIYNYDELTFRLASIQTIRGNETLQDLVYTYDPIGNIIHIQDNADIQNTIFFRNRRVEPSTDYIYDAIYRLRSATGREHLGQVSGALQPPTPTNHNDVPRINLPHPGDGNALGKYTEEYEYDEVGGILKIIHRSTDPMFPGWTRLYTYNEPSLIQSSVSNNRMTGTAVGEITELYTYDAHGNITSMPHLPLILWDYKDQLQATSKQRVNSGIPETTYYVYDSLGQRVRKVTELHASQGEVTRRKDERIYIGDFEIYRRYNGSGSTITLERETLHIMENKETAALVDTRTEGVENSPQQLVRYQFKNHLGSAVLETDAVGDIISYEEYYPYGSTSYQAVQKNIDVPLKRLRYISKERDEENGFYYHGARYYAPWLGKWTVPDPAGLVDGLNMYVYAKCQPVVMRDSSGRQARAPDELINPVIVKPGEMTGKESQEQIRSQYATAGIFYQGEAVWDEKHKTWWVDRSQLIKPDVKPTTTGTEPPKVTGEAPSTTESFVKGFVKGVAVGFVAGLAIGALIASGGTLALIGGALMTGGALTGGLTLGQILTGEDLSGNKLSNAKRAEMTGELLGGIVGGGLSAKVGPRFGPSSTGEPPGPTPSSAGEPPGPTPSSAGEPPGPTPSSAGEPPGQPPGEYLAGKAPKQVTPGTKTLRGQYVNDQGRVEPWEAHYDEYGRLEGRTDFNAGNKTEGIPSTHHHAYEYNSKFPFGRETISHAPGPYTRK